MGRRARLRVALAPLLLALAGCAGLGGPGSPGGTQAPYTIRGRSYVPLADWRGFAEDGLASWYGAEHQGRLTASGERFDRRGAHRRAPRPPGADVCPGGQPGDRAGGDGAGQ